MPEKPLDQLLETLNSRDPEEAWRLFLAEYGPAILQVVRHLEHDADLVPDCFQFVCEGLSANSFRRLRKFQPVGRAVFSTWLRAVVRNLCLDWRRKQVGRHRLFKSIAQLSGFDQEVFRRLYEQRLSLEEAFQSLRAAFPGVTHARVTDSQMRIEKELTPNQRRLLAERAYRQVSQSVVGFEDPPAIGQDVPDPSPNPEAQALLEERAAALRRALAQLSEREQLLIRLRYEEELTLEQVGKLLDLGNAQRVERQIKAVLARLRAVMN
jgi:RNA polymerase sigma factor (sigma-70 family)